MSMSADSNLCGVSRLLVLSLKEFTSEAYFILQVADSFSSTDPFQQGMVQPGPKNVMPLQKPPKWLQRPVGANFGVCLLHW